MHRHSLYAACRDAQVRLELTLPHDYVEPSKLLALKVIS